MVPVRREYNAEYVIEELRLRCSASSQAAVARELGISLQHVNDLLNGRRKMSDRVAQALGYRREIVFRRSA